MKEILILKRTRRKPFPPRLKAALNYPHLAIHIPFSTPCRAYCQSIRRKGERKEEEKTANEKISSSDSDKGFLVPLSYPQHKIQLPGQRSPCSLSPTSQYTGKFPIEEEAMKKQKPRSQVEEEKKEKKGEVVKRKKEEGMEKEEVMKRKKEEEAMKKEEGKKMS